MNDRIKPAVFSHLSKSHFFILLSAGILIAFWQLSSLQFTLKYDAVDITLPWRYFTLDALRQGVIPWWNPYQLHGYSHGSIPETWYPIGLLLGLPRGYGIIGLNLEYLLHLIIASFGCYRLARAMGRKVLSAGYIAMIFPLTGFFVGHAQHLGWIIAGAWIPHVLASYLYFLKSSHWKYNPGFLLAFFCLISGGYPGLGIVTIYVLLGLSIWHLMQKRHLSDVKLFFRDASAIAFLTVLISALIIACFYDLKMNITRGHGLQESAILIGSSRWEHLLSLLFPFTTVKEISSWWQSEQSIMNWYVGLPALIFSFGAMRYIPKYRNYFLLMLVALALSMAEQLPFRNWLNILPLFDLFRFPTLFRYFFILILLLLTANYLDEYFHTKKTVLTSLRKFSLIGIGLLVLPIIIFLFIYPSTVFKVAHLSIDTVKESLIFQFFSHAIILSLLFLGLSFAKNNYSKYFTLFIVTFLDLFVMVQTNGRVSIFSEQRITEMSACMRSLPQGYPTPSALDPIGTNEDRLLNFGTAYRNTSMMLKVPSPDGYSPYQHKGYVAFDNSQYHPKSLNLPVAYISKLHPLP